MHSNKDNRISDQERDGLYPFDDIDLKMETDQEETKDSLLKQQNVITGSKENDAIGPETEKSGDKEEDAKGLRQWFSKPRVKCWCGVIAVIVFLKLVLVGSLLAVTDDDSGTPVKSFNLINLWPRPNKQNAIYFVHGKNPEQKNGWSDLTKQLDELLSRYEPSANRSENVIECTGNSPPPMQENEVCKFDIRPLMQECTKSMNYGYDEGKPCIFLEFNNITDWIPEPYSFRDLESFVDVTDRNVANMVYLDCKGDSLVDQDNIGRIQYTPHRGFPTKYFPYRGQPDYMPPLVGLRFRTAAIGESISVTCKLYAKNINHTDDAVPKGKISFNLLVE